MNGQYLALEATLTVAISIGVAIATTALFLDVRNSIEGSVVDKEADIVKARLVSAANDIKEADAGSTEFVLPETVGGEEYTASVSDELIVVSTDTETFESSSGQLGSAYELKGSTSGGKSEYFKNEKSIRLGSG